MRNSYNSPLHNGISSSTIIRSKLNWFMRNIRLGITTPTSPEFLACYLIESNVITHRIIHLQRECFPCPFSLILYLRLELKVNFEYSLIRLMILWHSSTIFNKNNEKRGNKTRNIVESRNSIDLFCCVRIDWDLRKLRNRKKEENMWNQNENWECYCS